jgi:fructose-bisphosphate aldolase/2-amino-3,7-dideoxy-D-threo-hept-6-ulosonate synthase
MSSEEMGKSIRASRIINKETKRSLIVPLDHGIFAGIIRGLDEPLKVFRKVVEGGADAVLMPPGAARVCRNGFLGRAAPSLILRVDWTNFFRETLPAQTGSETLIASVEDAVRLGADAVITYFFVGYDKDEAEALNVNNAAKIARQCEIYGVPYIAEAMARGKRAAGHEYEPEYVKLHVRMAAEVGADFVKTDYTGDPDTFREIVKGCPAPILIAGGPKTKTIRGALENAKGALEAGAVGLFFGRNVFQAEDPTAMVRALRLIVHENAEVDDAMKLIEKKQPKRYDVPPLPVRSWQYY